MTDAVKIPDEVTFTGIIIDKVKQNITAEVKEIGSEAFFTCKITSITANKIEHIGFYAFAECGEMETAALGNSLKTIDGEAFRGCKSLKKVNLPDGLTTIGYRAFDGCSSLFRQSTLKIPASVTTWGGGTRPDNDNKIFASCGFQEVDYAPSVDIPQNMFENCKNLKSIKINANVQKIGKGAFSDCAALGSAENGSVELPNNCIEIGQSAFSGCSGMKNITFKNKLKNIGDWAFSRCSALTTLRFGEEFTDLVFGKQAFANCTGLTSIVFLKGKGITFGEETFSGLSNLETLTLAEGIVSLGNGNFNNCAKLNNFVMSGAKPGETPNLPSTITGIDNCFNGCSSLSYVDLPAPGQETFLVKNSFMYCPNIKWITLDRQNHNYKFDDDSHKRNISLYQIVPRPYKIDESGRAASNRAAHSILVTNGAFSGCTKLENVACDFTVGEGGGFYDCTKLVIDQYLLPYDEEVPSNAIPGHVKNAIVKETVRVLHKDAISNVDEINIPDSLRVMHENCLKTNASELILPDSVSEIYGNAIYGSNLKKLTILNPTPPVLHSETGRNIIYWSQGDVTLYVPYGCGDVYRTAETWKDQQFKDIVELEESGIEGIEVNDSNISIEIIDGRLTVNGCDRVIVYDMHGTLIYTGHPDDIINIPPGIYIVHAGKSIAKIAI